MVSTEEAWMAFDADSPFHTPVPLLSSCVSMGGGGAKGEYAQEKEKEKRKKKITRGE